MGRSFAATVSRARVVLTNAQELLYEHAQGSPSELASSRMHRLSIARIA